MTSLPGALSRSLDMLASPLVQGRVTHEREHRPWPLPTRRWLMAQTWMDLLFAHWSVSPRELQRVMPPQLPLDTLAGRAWIGVTPFEVRNLRLRPTPALPLLSTFPEINVRTYVTLDGRPGIYFFSLDAASRLAVTAARRAYRLPYFHSAMSIERGAREVRYRSVRSGPEREAPAAAFSASYGGVGVPFRAPAQSLEHWLTERYCLYTLDEQQRIQRGDIHHPPWPLQSARAQFDVNTMGDQIGISLQGEPLLHYARRQDVVFWALEPAR